MIISWIFVVANVSCSFIHFVDLCLISCFYFKKKLIDDTLKDFQSSNLAQKLAF